MVKFLERYNPSRLNHEETEDLNRPVTSKEIDSVIENLPAKKKQRPAGFTCGFWQLLRN